MTRRSFSEGMRRAFDLRNLRRSVDQDAADELEFHFESAVQELTRTGLSADQARDEAARRFGDRSRYLRELRRTDRATARLVRFRGALENAGQAIRLVVRGLMRSPGFALTAIVTLALGIGANATMFSIVDKLLLRPPVHVEDPGEVRRLMVQRATRRGESFVGSTHSFPDLGDWQAARSIRSIAAHSEWGEITMGRGAEATRIRASLAQASFFPTLGVRPRIGRFYGPDESRVGAEPVAVIGYELWRSAFGSDPSVPGRTLVLGGRTFTIIGVAPEGFTGMGLGRTDVWLPLEKVGVELAGNETTNRNDWWLQVVVRLAEGVSVEQAEAELTTLHRAGRSEQPEYDRQARVLAASAIAARGPEGSTPASVSLWLAGVSLIVLIIACANVANLFLARAARRRRELAVRLSLGIPRQRLVLMVLSESMLVALAAAAAATLLAAWGGSLVRTTLLPDVHWAGVGLDPRVALVTLGVTLLTGGLAGLAPALASRRTDAAEALRAGDGRSTSRRGVLRNVLLVLQPALSVVLLVGAGLFVRSLTSVRAIDLGFEPERLYTVGLETDQRDAALYQSAVARLERLPAVERAAAAFGVPFRNSWADDFRVPGLDSLPAFPNGGPYLNAVSPGFLATLGIALRRGRAIEATDREGSMPVVVLSEYLASRLWPGENPLGRCVVIGEGATACSTVIGVAEDAHRQELIEAPEALYYVPLAQHPALPPRALFFRARAGAADVRSVVRAELEGLDPRIRFAAVLSFRDMIDPQARAWTLGAAMFSLFGLLALAVAAVGIYGVFAFEVSRRVPEIGIRGALGADRGRIMRLVLGDVARMVGIGLGLGLLVALLAAPKLDPLLYNVSPRDPTILTGVALLLALVALGAGAVPALRAARVDPNVALRAE